jgi:hypothetical protein
MFFGVGHPGMMREAYAVRADQDALPRTFFPAPQPRFDLFQGGHFLFRLVFIVSKQLTPRFSSPARFKVAQTEYRNRN